MSTQPTDAMIEAGINAKLACEYHKTGVHKEVAEVWRAMQSARTPPPCAGDDVERVARALWEHEFRGEGKWPVNVENPEDWYSQARAAIAALGTTPSIVGQEKDELKRLYNELAASDAMRSGDAHGTIL